MNRRSLIAAGGLGLLGAGALLGHRVRSASDGPRGEYAADEPVTYEHGNLRLRAREDAIHLGERIALVVTNTTDSSVSLGCHTPWAVETYANGQWRTVAWTGDDYYDLCATLLPPGESRVERVRVAVDSLERRTGNAPNELQPGTYRFVLLGPSPFLAVDFEVLPARS